MFITLFWKLQREKFYSTNYENLLTNFVILNFDFKRDETNEKNFNE